MSKIYEALKKAHSDKKPDVPVARQPLPQEAQIESTPKASLVPPQSEKDPIAPHRTHAGISGQYLRFDDLLKQCAEPVWQADVNTIVFSERHKPHEGAEQFRTLRTRLYKMRDLLPVKRVLVTSAIAGEGKTFVATNLAQAIARERDRKVLLIDGDLRSARLHLPLGAPLSPGLSEYLRDEATEAEIIQHGQEGSLCFIAAGNGVGSNASELLSNGRLQKLLDRIAPLFDWVIVDSPPCVAISDSLVLADHCDGVLLVVRATSTPLALAQKACQELKGRNVIGVVLNAVEGAQSYGGYYYNGYTPSESKILRASNPKYMVKK
jgi:capsular exopolysaccharide synthesis family protein